MSIDYKNLNEEDLKLIDKWLGEYNHRTNFPIKNEERVFEFLNKIIQNKIQFNEKKNISKKKNTIETVYKTLKSLANLDSYYKKKYRNEINILTEGLTLDIRDYESSIKKDSTINQGQILETMLCIKEWEQLTLSTITSEFYEDFNSFLILLYRLRDKSYLKQDHKKIIINAIKMKNQFENDFDINK